MKKNKRNIFQLSTGLAAVLLLVGVVTTLPVKAEEIQESITLSPPTKHLKLDAGQVHQDEFTIINYGDTAYDFNVYTGPYSVKDEAYTPDFASEPANADAYRWISLEKARWRAEPKQTIKIPFTVNVSKGASAGGHYGVIFVETQPKEEANTTGIARKKRLALVIYATVSGPTETKGEVVSVDTPWFQSVPPVTSAIRIKNTGKTDFPATTRFAVMDLLGNVKYQNEQEAYVLPGTVRAVSIGWEQASWIGIYKVHSEATVLGKHTQHDSYVVIAPKWLLFVLGLVVLLGAAHVLRRRNSKPATTFRQRR